MINSDKRAEEFFQKLDSIGWFESLPVEARTKTLEALKKDRDNGNRPDLSIPGLSFDAECVEDEGIYEELINGLAENSFGIFTPQSVVEEWSEGYEPEIQVTITIKGKKYSSKWIQEGDYISEEFNNLLTKAIESSNPNFTLGCINPGDQCGLYVVCNKLAYEKAMELGLFMTYEGVTDVAKCIDNLIAIFKDKNSNLRLYAASLLSLHLEQGQMDVEYFEQEPPDDDFGKKVAAQIVEDYHSNRLIGRFYEDRLRS